MANSIRQEVLEHPLDESDVDSGKHGFGRCFGRKRDARGGGRSAELLSDIMHEVGQGGGLRLERKSCGIQERQLELSPNHAGKPLLLDRSQVEVSAPFGLRQRFALHANGIE